MPVLPAYVKHGVVLGSCISAGVRGEVTLRRTKTILPCLRSSIPHSSDSDSTKRRPRPKPSYSQISSLRGRRGSRSTTPSVIISIRNLQRTVKVGAIVACITAFVTSSDVQRSAVSISSLSYLQARRILWTDRRAFGTDSTVLVNV